jgi:hypothetical protein
MPQDQGQVQVTTPDGKNWTIPKANLAAAQARGAKLVTPKAPQAPPSTASTVGREATLGAFSGLGIPETKTPLQDIVKGITTNKPSTASLLDPTAGALTSAMGMVKDVYGSGKEAVQGIQRGDPGMIAHGVAEGITRLLMMKGMTELPDAEIAGNTTRNVAREVIGISDKDISKAISDSQTKAAEAQAKYQTELAEARDAHTKKVSEIQQANTDALDKYKSQVRTVKQGHEENVKSVDQHNAEAKQKFQQDLEAAKQEHLKKVADIEKKNVDAQAKHAETVQQLKAQAAKKIADTESKKVESSKAQSAAETRKAALQTKRGPVYQRMTEMADVAQKNVQDVDSKVRALEGAKWNAFRREVGNPDIDWGKVQNSVSDAERDILQGSPENIAIFKNIMKEGAGGQGGLADASVFRGSGGVDVKEFLSSIKDPVRRNQFIREMQAKGENIGEEAGIPKEGATVPMDTARGFYTELGEKIYGRELPGDVRRALRSVQDSIDGEITRSVAKAGGKDAVMNYRQLKSDWHDYMEAFYDKDSPLKKLKEGQDPNDKLRPIVGDEGERAIRLFGKYRNLGADVTQMGRTRNLFTTIKEMSSAGGKRPTATPSLNIPDAPRATEQPSVAGIPAAPRMTEHARVVDVPAAPSMKPSPQFEPPQQPTARAVTQYEARKAKIDQAAQTYAHPPSRWELMFPPLLAYRLALKKMLQSPAFKDWLAKGGQGAPPAP